VVIPSVIDARRNSRYRAVQVFPDRECVLDRNSPDIDSHGNGYAVNSRSKFLSGQKLGMPETPLSSKKATIQAEIFVAANQSIVFNYWASDSDSTVIGNQKITNFSTCALPISFTPEAEVNYELEFSDDISRKMCTFNLYRIGASIIERWMMLASVKRVDKCNPVAPAKNTDSDPKR
jgi:hypothetical protein